MRGSVAIVAGEREAMAALDLDDFPIDWTPLPHALETSEALNGAPLVHEGRAGNVLTQGVVECGDAERALADAAVTATGAIERSAR